MEDKKNKLSSLLTTEFMVRETGCGCPVDTSVHSTEAPTEAAAETLTPYELPLLLWIKQKTRSFDLVWCERRDLNPYELPHTPLKRARLPIPPLSRIYFTLSSARILYHFQMHLSILFSIFFQIFLYTAVRGEFGRVRGSSILTVSVDF